MKLDETRWIKFGLHAIIIGVTLVRRVLASSPLDSVPLRIRWYGVRAPDSATVKNSRRALTILGNSRNSMPGARDHFDLERRDARKEARLLFSQGR